MGRVLLHIIGRKEEMLLKVISNFGEGKHKDSLGIIFIKLL